MSSVKSAVADDCASETITVDEKKLQLLAADANFRHFAYVKAQRKNNILYDMSSVKADTATAGGIISVSARVEQPFFFYFLYANYAISLKQ